MYFNYLWTTQKLKFLKMIIDFNKTHSNVFLYNKADWYFSIHFSFMAVFSYNKTRIKRVMHRNPICWNWSFNLAILRFYSGHVRIFCFCRRLVLSIYDILCFVKNMPRETKIWFDGTFLIACEKSVYNICIVRRRLEWTENDIGFSSKSANMMEKSSVTVILFLILISRIFYSSLITPVHNAPLHTNVNCSIRGWNR